MYPELKMKIHSLTLMCYSRHVHHCWKTTVENKDIKLIKNDSKYFYDVTKDFCFE